MSYMVDVVILSWNRLHDTIAAIESCLLQVGLDVHVYVVDQGSDSEVTSALEERYAESGRVILKFLHENVGVAKGRNIGYNLGSSPFIFSLDNDAKLVDYDTLNKAAQKMVLDESIAVLSFKVVNYTEEEDGRLRSFATVYNNRLDSEFDSVRFAGGAHLIRRSVFLDVHGYDPELFFGGEEEELSRKIINIGGIIRYDPTFHVMHRCTSEGKVGWSGKRYYYMVRNRLYIRMKFCENFVEVAVYAVGYMIKGLLNFVFFQAIMGVKDSIKLFLKFKKSATDPDLYSTNVLAREYLKKNEEVLRGSFLNKVRKELLAKLPKV